MAKKMQYVVDEEINQFDVDTEGMTGAIRMISWYNNESKVDIRKWIGFKTETEFSRSGIVLSVNETNALTEKLVESGFGDKDNLIRAINTRDKVRLGAVESSIENVEDLGEEDYYDPKEALL